MKSDYKQNLFHIFPSNFDLVSSFVWIFIFLRLCVAISQCISIVWTRFDSVRSVCDSEFCFPSFRCQNILHPFVWQKSKHKFFDTWKVFAETAPLIVEEKWLISRLEWNWCEMPAGFSSWNRNRNWSKNNKKKEEKLRRKCVCVCKVLLTVI